MDNQQRDVNIIHLEDEMERIRASAILFLFCTTIFGLTETTYAKAKVDFRTAMKIAEIEKLGAKSLDGATIQTTFSGKTLKGLDWSWTFNSDGTESSKANDNSWTDKGTWHLSGNQLCRTSTATKGATELCSNIYTMGQDVRMSDPRSSGVLHKWYLTY